MLKKFFRRKPDGSSANDGSFRSPPGPAPYQPAVPREAGDGSSRALPGDSDSSHGNDSPDQSPPMYNAHTSQHRRQYPAQQQPMHQHQPHHQVRAQQHVQNPQHQLHLQHHPHHPNGYAPRSQQHPPAQQQHQQYAQNYAPPQQQPHHRAHSANQHAMTGPEPDNRAFAQGAPAPPQLMQQQQQQQQKRQTVPLAAPALMQAPQQQEQRAPLHQPGEVYYDDIPDLQNPAPSLYTAPAPAAPALARPAAQAPTVISGVKPFQPRAAPSSSSASAAADVGASAGGGSSGARPSLEGLQQQHLVSALTRSRIPSSSSEDVSADHAPPAAAAVAPPPPANNQVPRVLGTKSSAPSGGGGGGGGGVAQPRVIQTTHHLSSARQHHHHASGGGGGGGSAEQPQAQPGRSTKTATMAPPKYSEVPSTVLCVLGEMDAVSPLVRELQITVLKQELSLGKAARELDRRRRRESWPPRLDMDKIRALERSMMPSALANAPSSPAKLAVASPRAQQDEALGVDPGLPIKGRLAQLRERWEGKGGSIPLPTLTSSMPKVQPKWNRHAPVHYTSAQPAPVSTDDDDEGDRGKGGASLTIQGLSLAVSGLQPSTPSTPQKAQAPLAAPVQPEPEPEPLPEPEAPAEIPQEQFAFRLPGESAPDTAADRPGGGLNTVEPLFKPRGSPFAALLAPREEPPPAAPKAAPAPPRDDAHDFSIPDLQLDGLDGEEEEEGGGGMELAPVGATGSTGDNSLDAPCSSSSPPPPAGYASGPADSSPPAALASAHYQPPRVAGYGHADAESAEPEFGAVPVEVAGLAVDDEEEGAVAGGSEEGNAHDDSVVVDLAAALMTGAMARLNKKIKDFEDGFWVLSCKGSEGHAAGVNIGFAYKLECFGSKRAAATNEEPDDSMFLQGATVKFVQGTVFKVQTTNELNKKGTTNMMSTNSEKEMVEWMSAMELVPDVTVDWVGKDGSTLAH